MGTITRNYAEQGSGTGAPLATHTFTFTRDNINVVDTEYINYPTLELTTSVKYNISSGGRTAIYDYGQFELRASNPQGTVNTIGRFGFSTDVRTLSANVAYTQTINRDGYANSYTGASFFSSANPTVREVDIHLFSKYLYVETGYPVGGGIAVVGSGSYTTETDLGVIGKIVFNRPPTFTASALTIDTTSAYTNITTASVSISNLSAKLGGTIASATLTIGNQSVSRTDNGTLSILLNQGGTFTPTLTVTDSRGVSATQTFDNLVVNVYSQPTVSFDVERTTSTGTPDDEGTHATVDATFTFSDVIADAVAPTIVVTDNDGVTQTVSTTWYSTRANDGTLSGSVTWANLSSGDTVYGLVSITGGFDTQKSYEIALTPEDSESTGTTITQTLGSAFYTVDFLAGGHGIAFGKPSSNEGFECAMDASFIDANGTMRALFDFIYPVGSYYETSDTTFDPNITWGGTWSLEAEGLVHIGAGSNYTIGDTGGEAKHTLTVDEMPSHTHNTGSLVNATGTTVSTMTAGGGAYGFGYGNQGLLGSTGGGQAHNNMQPYIVVNRWHRTA